MMVNYKAIADAIPAASSAAAYAELAIFRPSLQKRLVGGVITDVPYLDDEGDEVWADGKFMTDVNVVVAFNSIKDLTVNRSKGSVVRQTYRSLSAYLDIGIAGATALETAITASTLSPWVHEVMNDEGLNVKDPQVEAALTGLVSTDLKAAILATGNEVVSVFPRLKSGHVQNALQKRYRGEI
jgi:hypothetical protein